jgi:hypothetical protein
VSSVTFAQTATAGPGGVGQDERGQRGQPHSPADAAKAGPCRGHRGRTVQSSPMMNPYQNFPNAASPRRLAVAARFSQETVMVHLALA